MTTPQDPYGDPGPGQPGGYPDTPYPAGMPSGQPALPPRRPAVVAVAAALWVLTGLFFLLPGLLVALTGDNATVQQELENAVARSGIQIDPDTVAQGIVVAGIVMAVLGALLVLGGLLLLGRSNAARVLVTVLGVVAALLLLGTVIGTLVVLLAIVLQFLPSANTWFRYRRGPV